MRVDLPEDPAVIAMATKLAVSELTVVGGLHKLWSWADRHTTDGNAHSVTTSWINRYIMLPNFAEAMIDSGWLEVGDGVRFPNFERHNGESGKKRAITNKRVAEHREMKRKCNDDSVTKSVTREEKRREEKKDQIQTQSLTLPDWLPVEPWNDYVKHRGSKFTHRAKELTLAQLGKMVESGHDPTEILQTSIANGWKGIFEPKSKGNGYVSNRDRERAETIAILTGRSGNTYENN